MKWSPANSPRARKQFPGDDWQIHEDSSDNACQLITDSRLWADEKDVQEAAATKKRVSFNFAFMQSKPPFPTIPAHEKFHFAYENSKQPHPFSSQTTDERASEFGKSSLSMDEHERS